MQKNKIKSDVILKNFWRNNQRFADLFNAALFHGKSIINPSDLREMDTDISSLLKFNNHAETVQKILDVVKKTAYGIDFVIWGLENQSKIHYAMPLRHMIGDAFSYLKEYNEIATRNRHDHTFESSDEFLSNFKKTDRLHPVISLCVYYGESKWDGPVCLTDMLNIPEELKSSVSDYKMNLIQIRTIDSFLFHNDDVRTVFDISRSIYEEDYDKIKRIYKDQHLNSELGLVIGAITESQQLIDHSLQSEQKGGVFNMCTALENLEKRCVQKGRMEGRSEGVQALIRAYKKFHSQKEDTIKAIISEFSMTEAEARKFVEQYW